MTMGFGIYEQSFLLLTNACEDFIAKSKGRELFLHYKIYKGRKDKRNGRKPLYRDTSKQRTLGVCSKLSIIWRFHCSSIVTSNAWEHFTHCPIRELLKTICNAIGFVWQQILL